MDRLAGVPASQWRGVSPGLFVAQCDYVDDSAATTTSVATCPDGTLIDVPGGLTFFVGADGTSSVAPTGAASTSLLCPGH